MPRLIFTLTFVLILAACGNDIARKTSERIDGRWRNERNSIRIDIDSGTLTGMIDNEPVECAISILREEGRTVELQANDTRLFVTLRNPDMLIVTGETGGPRVLTRPGW